MKSHVTTIEMSEAKLLWFQNNQSQLKQSKNYLEIKKTLNLHEYDMLIRSYSRLKNAKILFDSKAPIMLLNCIKHGLLFIRALQLEPSF